MTNFIFRTQGGSPGHNDKGLIKEWVRASNCPYVNNPKKGLITRSKIMGVSEELPIRNVPTRRKNKHRGEITGTTV